LKGKPRKKATFHRPVEEMSASAESAADEPTSISTAKIANDTTESREEPRISVSIDASTQEYPDLELPLTAADGLIKKPFSRPIDTAKPIEPPELTPDQVAKYQSVLETVSSWTTLPESPAKDASTTPVTDEERMYLTQGTLLRYLRASKWNVSEAVNRLHGTLVWRREYLPPLTSDYISIENETGKQLILGYDVTGRPCIIMQPSKQNTETSDRQIQHLVFMLERAVELMQPDQETLAFIVNFNETRTGQNATISQARQAVHILQYHYPERLGRALVINCKNAPVPYRSWRRISPKTRS
jgi:phosphatidylinositol/phosphatidylcholine transfer protein